MPQGRRPGLPARLGLVAGAAGHQATHAVGEEVQARHGLRPLGKQGLQQVGQGLPVGGDVQARVVAQVEHRAAQVPGQGCAVIEPTLAPLLLVVAKAMDEDQQAAAGHGKGRAEGGGLQDQGLALVVQAHGGGQRIARGGEVIAQHAVQGRHKSLPLGRGQRLPIWWLKGRQGRIHAQAHGPGQGADGPVDQPADAPATHRLAGLAPRQWMPDALVHGLHQVRHADSPLHSQSRQPTQVRGNSPKVGNHLGGSSTGSCGGRSPFGFRNRSLSYI